MRGDDMQLEQIKKVLTHKPQQDIIASLVVSRLAEAYQYKATHKVYQNKSAYQLLTEAHNQFNKKYDGAMVKTLQGINGNVPTKYLGLTQIKVNAMRAWKRDLVFSNMDAIFSVFPTPIPTIDEYSKNNISNSVKRAFAQRLIESGVLDPNILVDTDGDLPAEVKDFIEQQLKYHRGIEEARIVSRATQAAKLIETKLQDILTESNFRQEYSLFTQNQCLFGHAIMKFPTYNVRASYKHRKNGGIEAVYKSIPDFRNVSPFHIFPTSDTASMRDCAGVTEVIHLSKYQLLRLLQSKERDGEVLDKQAIKDIFQEFESLNRNWIVLPYIEQDLTTNTFWDMDKSIPALLHEGFVSGRELHKMGITGYSDYEYANVEALIIANRTVSLRVIKSPDGEERSYFDVPFIRTGTDMWDAIGLAGMLKDTEDRINTILRLWECNIEWSSLPTYIYNREVFEDPNARIRAGMALPVNQELFAQLGNHIPDPVRIVSTVSSQYQLLWSAITQWVRMADEECGIPAFAYGAANYGKASLGEYAQRMSNALRTVKEASAEEDAHFIEPAFENMYYRIISENKSLIEGQDIDLQVRGITGLMAKDLQGSSSVSQMHTIMQLAGARPDIIDNNVVEYSIYNYLRNEGFPVEALGISNPLVESALDIASARAESGLYGQPETVNAFETQQVPTLDGRSASMPSQLVSNSAGRSNYGVGTNQYNTPQQDGL